MTTEENQAHPAGYRVFFLVWVALLALTAALVFIARRWHEALSVPAMLTITPIKAALVFYYFMHLKWEKPLLKFLVLVTLAILVVVIGLLFTDVSFQFQ